MASCQAFEYNNDLLTKKKTIGYLIHANQGYAYVLQPSQNVSEEEVILKLEAVWLPKATFGVPIGREHVGGSRGILLREIFEI